MPDKVIIVARYNEDLSWIQKLLERQDWIDQVIIYNKGGTVELHNISNYLENESKINLSGINDTTLIVFAGSARYYLHQIYGVVSSDNSEEFTKAAMGKK